MLMPRTLQLEKRLLGKFVLTKGLQTFQSNYSKPLAKKTTQLLFVCSLNIGLYYHNEELKVISDLI